MAFPFWLLGLLAPLFSDAISGGQDNTTTQTTTTPPPTPFDPAYSMLSPALMSMLAQNVNRLSGAGFPGGKGIGGDLMADMIAQVSQAWPDIMGGYGGPATGNGASCSKQCESSGGVDSPGFKACYNGCMNRGKPGGR